MTPHRMFRYRFLDNQGDRVEIILAEPGSIFVRSHDAAFAALWEAPPGDLRTWLSTMDITYATANLLVRSGCRFARTKKLDAVFTRDIAKWWGAFQAEILADIVAPAVAASGGFDIPLGSTKTNFGFKGIVRAPAEDAAALAGSTGLGYPTMLTAEMRAAVRACLGLEKSAPVVAEEGRYAASYAHDGGRSFLDVSPDHDRTCRSEGTRAEVISAIASIAAMGPEAGDPGEVVRILADGEHEAALAAARREERERVLASIGPQRAHVLGAADRTNGVEAVRLYGQVDGLDYVRGLLGDEAAKGQSK